MTDDDLDDLYGAFGDLWEYIFKVRKRKIRWGRLSGVEDATLEDEEGHHYGEIEWPEYPVVIIPVDYDWREKFGNRDVDLKTLLDVVKNVMEDIPKGMKEHLWRMEDRLEKSAWNKGKIKEESYFEDSDGSRSGVDLDVVFDSSVTGFESMLEVDDRKITGRVEFQIHFAFQEMKFPGEWGYQE